VRSEDAQVKPFQGDRIAMSREPEHLLALEVTSSVEEFALPDRVDHEEPGDRHDRQRRQEQ